MVSVWPGVGRMAQQSTVVLGQVSTVLASSGGHAGVWRRAKVVSKKLGGMGDMMEARVTAGSPPGRRGRRSMAQMGGFVRLDTIVHALRSTPNQVSVGVSTSRVGRYDER